VRIAPTWDDNCTGVEQGLPHERAVAARGLDTPRSPGRTIRALRRRRRDIPREGRLTLGSREITLGGILARHLQSNRSVSNQTATDIIQLEDLQDSRVPTRLNGSPDPKLDEFEQFLRHAESMEGGEPLSLKAWLHLAEAWRITQALRKCRGNRSAAARALGIGRRTLYAKMEKLGITATWGI
jgi:DNA-binding protein Fis